MQQQDAEEEDSLSIERIPAGDLHVTSTPWLESRNHFLPQEWGITSRPPNFGALKVVNDDTVRPRTGFGAHPHRDMEIFSYVVDGQLTHQDSMGNKEALSRGCVQYMSAGTGVHHSEMNEGDEPVRFVQVWLLPERHGHAPQYGSSVYAKQDRHNRLLQILGGTGPTPAWPDAHDLRSIKLYQDANVFVSESDAGVAFEGLELGINRTAYLVCIEGRLAVNDTLLNTRDAARITGSSFRVSQLNITALQGGAHFLIIEMDKA